MQTYYLEYKNILLLQKHADILFEVKKYTKNIDSEMLETKSGRLMLSSKCAVCGSKTSRFPKEQQAKGLLSNLGLKTPLSKIPILYDVLF